jgi:hypothetical protein
MFRSIPSPVPGGPAFLAALLLLTACAPEADTPRADAAQLLQAGLGAPRFEADTAWPRDLPAHWVLGPGTGVHVDDRDHAWILHRPERISPEDMEAAFDPSISDCCVPAPPLMELDPEGNLVQAWGSVEPAEDWPLMPHGVFVDHQGHVWVATSIHHQVMKFTRNGEHLLTIGVFDEVGGSNHPELLGGSADIHVDPETNELFVADGYVNRRVVVFDAETGAYLRHWGAYGERPSDDVPPGPRDESGPPPRHFSLPHGVDGSRDGLIYVADRTNSRIQVFRRDGTFVRERTLRPGAGAAFDVAFSPDPDQAFLYVADGVEHRIRILRRSDLEPLVEFGSEGTGPGELGRPHNLAVDSRGNVYVAEADPGRRFQRFLFRGVAER